MEEQNETKKDEHSDFSKGIDLLTKALYDGAKKASFQLGFGTLSMGITYLNLKDLSAPDHIKMLIGLGVFFISAKIGGLCDELIDNKKNTKDS